MPDSVSTTMTVALPPRPSADQIEAGKQMESHFLAEMLSFTGLNATPEGFGGGAGEDQFSSFLRREQANQITQAGGIGLAEIIAKALMEADR
jgi:flagellar protein FlgJ